MATLLGVPAGWVAGGMLAVSAASLAGVNTHFPRSWQPPVFLVLGIYSGSGVTRETLSQMQTWPASFAVLGVSVVALVGTSYWWLHSRHGWARNDALLSSLPGALSFVIAAAENLQADIKRIAIAQGIRILVLVEAFPLAALAFGHPTGAPALAARPVAGPRDLAVLLAAGLAAAFAANRLRLPGGWMIGGLASSAVLFLSGAVDARLPVFLVVPCSTALAAITGSRFRPGDLPIIFRLIGPAFGALVLSAAISAVGAATVTLLFGVNIIQTLMAFAPGALEALTLLAYQMNVDPAYVAAHHVVRFVALIIAVPLLTRWLGRR